MYPYEIIFGLTLYDILIAAGVAAAILLFSYLADKRGIKKKLQSLVMACTLCALAGGWFFAVLTQSFYNYLETGVFTWGGMTFYGGFVGGAACFLLVYFIGGKIAFKKTDNPRYYLTEFFTVADIAACCVCAAHARQIRLLVRGVLPRQSVRGKKALYGAAFNPFRKRRGVADGIYRARAAVRSAVFAGARHDFLFPRAA